MSPDVAAAVALLACAAVIVVWGVVALVRSPLSVPLSLVYGFDVLVARLLWRAQVSNRLPIPPGMGAVLVANHRTSADPFVIQPAVRRVIHWMVAKEYYRRPILGRLLWFFGAIPTSRSGIDTASVRTAMRLVSDGKLVGMFPEGRINRSSDLLLPSHAGAALVALRARVPIVPCYVEGMPYTGTVLGPFFTPARVRVKIGQPLHLNEYYDRGEERPVLEEITLRAMREIANLAGRHEYEPRLLRSRPAQSTGDLPAQGP